jgi:hypothetical protein
MGGLVALGASEAGEKFRPVIHDAKVRPEPLYGLV